MADVSLNFTVTPVTANVIVANNQITMTPNPTTAVVYAGGFATPAHGVTGNMQVQFNNNGILGGTPNFLWANNSSTLSVAGNVWVTLGLLADTASFANNLTAKSITSNTTVTTGNIVVNNFTNLGSINNITIAGGTNNTYLRTNGAGQLSFATITMPTPQGAANSIQYNNGGELGGIATMNYDSANQFVDLGYQSNIKIQGGLNGYFLQTDGTGNLAWSQATAAGNGTVGGISNTVQFNDNGDFAGNTNFTYNVGSSTLNVRNLTSDVLITANTITTSNITTANLIVSNNFTSSGNITSDLNITGGGIGTFGSLVVNGTSKLQQAKEKVNIVASSATGNINFDLLTSAITYYTGNISANVTLNFRGNSSTAFTSFANVGESVTAVFMTKIGSTVYIPTIIQVDGSNVTPQYSGGLTPFNGSSPNSVGSFSYTIIRNTSNTYSVLGSVSGFV